MTDYLPPPPAEIVVEDVVPGQLEYEAQGGQNFKFWNKVSDTFYSQANVYQYEQLRRSFDMKVRQIEEFEESLKEALSDERIDSDLAQTFADIFDISLTREYEVTVNVRFSMTVELPMGEDIESFVDNVTFSVDDPRYSDGEITDSDYDVTDSYCSEV